MRIIERLRESDYNVARKKMNIFIGTKTTNNLYKLDYFLIIFVEQQQKTASKTFAISDGNKLEAKIRGKKTLKLFSCKF